MLTTNQVLFSNFLENLFPKSDIPKYLTPHRIPYRPFLQVTREIENNKNYKGGGWDAEKQLWFPHASKEGGRQTIGYGHKLTEEEVSNNTYVNGLTDQEVEDLYRKDIEKHYVRTKESFRKKGFGDFDSLPPLKQAILIDYEYTGTGPHVFPKFTEALLKDDTTSLKKEYLRYLKKNPLKSRNAVTKDFLNLKLGGKFTPKKSKLVKNAEEQNSKRDMRKKFIKSDRPTYTNNRVKKNQSGGVLSIDPSIFVSWNNISTSNIKLPEVDYTPKSNLDRFLERTENSVSINLLGNPKEQEEKQDQKEIPVSKEEPIVKKTPLANPSKGNDAFNKIYDELISEMPDAAEYRDFLTTVAKYESGFDSRAKNKYAPAWGYFQFMQDDNKYNNIKSYAGVDTQTFLNNPKLQIRAAINLAKAMEKGFTKEDIEAAKSKGISRWGMLGGAWLGGNGGLRKYLLQNINSSDKHWNPEGKGIDMENQIRRYNF